MKLSDKLAASRDSGPTANGTPPAADEGAALDVEELHARLSRLESAQRATDGFLSALEGAGGPSGANGAASGAGAVVEPFYEDVVAWVEGMFAPTFARRLGAVQWCPQWRKHPEAVLRLEALWRSWETLRLDPTTGMGVWLREYLDPQRLVLMGADGPFHGCDEEHHSPAPPLPIETRGPRP